MLKYLIGYKFDTSRKTFAMHNAVTFVIHLLLALHFITNLQAPYV